MKKFNLFNEIIIINKPALLQALNSSKTFGIDINAEIKYEPFTDKDILIYIKKHMPQKTDALMPNKQSKLSDIFGQNYQIVEDDDRVLIKAFSNWQKIISFNINRASYDDTTADGVAEFSDKELEDIGWNATEFNITYREYVELLEEHCDGTLICIEQEEPYQFSGLGFLSDNKQAREILFKYSQNKIKKLMREDKDYAKENLSNDELEAVKFFQLI